MSNMKNLLGDITMENVELMNLIMEDDLTDSEYESIINLWDKYGEFMYDYWMENYGRQLAIKWVIEHGDEEVSQEWMTTYKSYIVDKFMEWIKSNGNV